MTSFIRGIFGEFFSSLPAFGNSALFMSQSILSWENFPISHKRSKTPGLTNRRKLIGWKRRKKTLLIQRERVSKRRKPRREKIGTIRNQERSRANKQEFYSFLFGGFFFVYFVVVVLFCFAFPRASFCRGYMLKYIFKRSLFDMFRDKM